MRRFVISAFAAACCVSSTALAQEVDPRWSRMTEIFTRNDNAYARGDIFANTHTGVHRPSSCSAGNWCTVDVTDYGIPADAKSVFLSGILIITHGTNKQIADLYVGFRSFGDNSPLSDLPASGGAWYIGQAVETSHGDPVNGVFPGGIRSTMSTWVPVRYGKFQFTYSKTTEGPYPENSTYAVNLTIQAWGR